MESCERPVIASDNGAPPESLWLIVIGIVVCPLALAATTDAIRMSRTQEPDSGAELTHFDRRRPTRSNPHNQEQAAERECAVLLGLMAPWPTGVMSSVCRSGCSDRQH